MGYDYDLAVIGSGPAGEKGAAQAAFYGKRVVVIEKARAPGGAAVHTGTLPSKTLRESAVFLAGHRQRDIYGINVTVDQDLAVQRMLARRDAVRAMEVDRIRWNLDRHGIATVEGFARLVDAHTVEVATEVGPTRITSEYILLATGSTPYHPANIDFDDAAIDDSDTILEIERLPQRLTVVGGGVIGCEYACMFAELGVAVTLIEGRAELLPFLDQEVSATLLAAMRAKSIDVRLEDGIRSVRRDGASIAVQLKSGGHLEADRLLYAAGRTGVTAGMNLQAVGVELTERGQVIVDSNYRTATPSILAAGDLVGFPALASTSMEQGRIAVCKAFGFDYRQGIGGALPYGIYTIPEVSCVGYSEEDAKAAGIEAVCGHAAFEMNARARINGTREGFTKLVFRRDDRTLIGAHLVGDQATELVHIGEAIISLRGTVETVIEMVFNYPTLAETYKYAAYDALGKWG